MSEKGEKSSSLDIFQLLEETTEKEKKRQREELLAPLGIEEFFIEGSISINKRTCQEVERKFCVEACPTNALFWRAGEVGITPELCVYCAACVLSCIVDDCMKIVRKRSTGKVESFSKPTEVIALLHCINARRRLERTRCLFPRPEDYLKRYKPIP